MRLFISIVCVMTLVVAQPTRMSAAQEGPQPLPMLRQPSISPDGDQIAFVHNGDIYLAPTAGGMARALVTGPGFESLPRFSPDGARLAYTSNATGGGDVYVLDLATGQQRRLTHHSAGEFAESWSPDGALVYFSSDQADIGGYSDIFAVTAEGGTPFPISRARYEGEYNAQVSPDGGRVLFNINDRTRQWWRTGERHDDSTDVWLRSTNPAAPSMRQLTRYDGKDSWPLWSGDGRGFYFVTDRFAPTGVENLAYQTIEGGRAAQLTRFTEGHVLWPSISRDGVIAFERDFEIWTVSRGSAPRRVAIELPAESPQPARTRDFSQVSDIAVTPDMSAAALIIHGDVFVYRFQEERLLRITETPEPEQAVTINASGDIVAYASLRAGFFDIFVQAVGTGAERRLTNDAATETNLRFSPDGRQIAYTAGPTRLRTVRLADSAVHDVASGSMLQPEFAWAPDSRSIAYMAADGNWMSNVFVRDVPASAPPVQLTDFPNVYFSGLSWTSDGRSLLLSTWTTREARQIARVRANADTSTTAARDNIAFLAPEDESLILVASSPNGALALLVGSIYGQRGLWSADIGERSISNPQLVSRGGDVAAACVADDGRAVFVQGGTVFVVAPGGAPRRLTTTASFSIDASAQRNLLFRQTILLLRDYFADAGMTDANLETLYRRYAPNVAGATRDDDFMIAARMMIGELNASHTNIWGDEELQIDATGDLGVDFNPSAIREGRFEVVAVHQSDTARLSPLSVGDRLVSLDGVSLSRGVNLHALLVGKSGEVLSGEVAGASGTRAARIPVYDPEEVAEARYQAWVAANAQLVERLSQGRLAYVHLRHIGAGATEDLRRRLGASALGRSGVIIDIRNNGGGVESTRLMSFLQSRSAVRSRFQNVIDAPAPLIHGIPSFGVPVALVQNEQVLSDAENFSHEFRSARLGPVIGVRTAAWNRGQRSNSLFDGTRVSIGAFNATSRDGEIFDRVGRSPDIVVDQSPEESLSGRDSQLEAAVAALLRDRAQR